MSVAFTMSLPLEDRFRDLASDVAGKYVELVGGTAADAEALAGSVAEQVGHLAQDAEDSAAVELEFAFDASSIDVTLRCNGRSATVRQPLPARKT